MVRQAHTYLVGAMGGATLIGVSIAVFVVLVSAQVFKDWPIASLGGGETTAVSTTHRPAGSGQGSTAGSNPTAATAGGASRAAGGPGAAAGSHGSVAGGDGVGAFGGSQGTTAEQGGSAGSGGNRSGGSATDGSPQAPSSAGPNANAGSSGSGGNGPGSTGAGSGGGSTGGGASSPSGQVTETVGNTVSGVDEKALGGTLHETGVTEITEGVVNGAAGPESPVGNVVDETVGAVGGLLHGNR
jgi:hypothetical protein